MGNYSLTWTPSGRIKRSKNNNNVPRSCHTFACCHESIEIVIVWVTALWLEYTSSNREAKLCLLVTSQIPKPGVMNPSTYSCVACCHISADDGLVWLAATSLLMMVLCGLLPYLCWWSGMAHCHIYADGLVWLQHYFYMCSQVILVFINSHR